MSLNGIFFLNVSTIIYRRTVYTPLPIVFVLRATETTHTHKCREAHGCIALWNASKWHRTKRKTKILPTYLTGTFLGSAQACMRLVWQLKNVCVLCEWVGVCVQIEFAYAECNIVDEFHACKTLIIIIDLSLSNVIYMRHSYYNLYYFFFYSTPLPMINCMQAVTHMHRSLGAIYRCGSSSAEFMAVMSFRRCHFFLNIWSNWTTSSREAFEFHTLKIMTRKNASASYRHLRRRMAI